MDKATAPKVPKGFSILRTPAGGIEFFPPRDSDALFDALRAAFPSGKSHLERMVDAVKDFLVSERTDVSTSGSSPYATSAAVNGLGDATWDTESGSDRHTDVPEGRTGKGRSKGKQSEVNRMTTVWSSKSGDQYHYRARRTMTEEERKDYRIKRVIGVCQGCKRRKRKCTHDARALEETPMITVVPRRDSTKKPRHLKQANVSNSHFVDTSSATAVEASITDIDLGYATEEWLLESDVSQPLPYSPPIVNASSVSNPAVSVAMPQYPFTSESDSSSLWWHDPVYPPNLNSTSTGWIDLFDTGLSPSHNWSTILETTPVSQLDPVPGEDSFTNVDEQSDVPIQTSFSSAITPLDGYLADSEDEAYGSCEERKARGGKQSKRQQSLELKTVAPSDLVR